MSSPEFATSNRMFYAVIKNLKQQGLDQSKHFDPINSEDFKKLNDEKSFDLTDPFQLQEKVFFDVMLNFARNVHNNVFQLG